MHYLYAPWRAKYFKGKHDGACIFCHINESSDDEENLVLFRSKNFYVVMNLFPYNIGEIMINPKRHLANYEDLNEEELFELAKLTKIGILTLKKERKAQGINVGYNLGDIAGAGIAQHLHCHIVPRYFGDTNFITTIGDTRVLGMDFKEIFQGLKKTFEELYKENF